jgi:hypothetical protein
VLGRNERLDMSLFCEPPHGDVDWEHLEDSHHVVYLVKRPAYAFVFAVPRIPPPTLGAELAFFRIRFMDTPQPCDIALGLSELEGLYKDLHLLMEYMRQEREKRCGEL